MKRKSIKIITISLLLSSLLSFSSLAAWEQSETGWKYKDDITQQYVASQWIESTTEKGLWYYVGADGIMATNIWVDDVYYVNERGEWRDTTGGSKDNSNMASWLNEDGTVYWIPDDEEFDTTPGWGGKDVIVG